MERKRLLRAENLEKTYGSQKLFKIDNLEIYEGDRIGLIGANGVGKTTLLHMLSQSIRPDKGRVEVFVETSSLDQQLGEWITLEEEVMDYSVIGTLGVFQNAGHSGGEKTKRAIANLMARPVPLLFIDEPTTNLDVDSIEKLEEYLQSFKGSYIVVSHDQRFLDNVCNKLWVLVDQQVREFYGTVSDWERQRQREHDFEMFEYTQYQAEKKRKEAEAAKIYEAGHRMLDKRKNMSTKEQRLYSGTAKIQQAHVQKRAKVMLKRLSQFEEKRKPNELPAVSVKLGAASDIRSKTALWVEGLHIQYGDNTIIETADFNVQPQQKNIIIGANGSGKTSIITAIKEGDETVRVSPQANIGYFSQHQDLLDDDKTVLDNVKKSSHLSEGEIRIILANLLFSKEDVFKKVNVLSGGERAKTELARLIVSGHNFLILDEPTNHFDLVTRKAILEMLTAWKGTLLVVSHDREFVSRLGDRLLIVEDKTVRTFEGNYDSYIDQ